MDRVRNEEVYYMNFGMAEKLEEMKCEMGQMVNRNLLRRDVKRMPEDCIAEKLYILV